MHQPIKSGLEPLTDAELFDMLPLNPQAIRLMAEPQAKMAKMATEIFMLREHVALLESEKTQLAARNAVMAAAVCSAPAVQDEPVHYQRLCITYSVSCPMAERWHCRNCDHESDDDFSGRVCGDQSG